MSYDQNGRSIRDRLTFQKKLLTILKDTLPVPKVHDFVEEDGNSFLIMEFIEGVSLHQYITRQFNGQDWLSMGRKEKIALLNYFLQIVGFIKSLHERGIYHRDITPANFMINDQGELLLIDLELCYSTELFNGLPPFSYGTPGFMSAEQEKVHRPTEKEDIFGLGAMLICFVTGLSPYQFQVQDERLLLEHLFHFTGEYGISSLIVKCLKLHPEQRPLLSEIQSRVAELLSSIHHYAGKQITKQKTPSNNTIICTLNDLLPSLKAGKLADGNGIWYSKPHGASKYFSNASAEKITNHGFYSGLSGILYVLPKLKSYGINLSVIDQEINANWGCLEGKIKAENMHPGLYNGRYGIVMALAAGMSSGIVEVTEQTRALLKQLLQCETDKLSLADGVAGWGTAVLAAHPFLNDGLSNEILTYCISQLINHQEKDGSWVLRNEDSPRQTVKLPGYAHGASGILCFLLNYYKINPDQAILQTIEKGFSWLKSPATIGKLKLKTQNRTALEHNDQWLDNGAIGITLALIKGYHYIGNDQYKVESEKLLLGFDPNINFHRMSLGSGLAGLGLIYLAAYSVFHDPRWKGRHEHIMSLLLNTYNTYPHRGGITWLTNDSNFPTAGLMNGAIGIGLYLLAHLDEKIIQDPLFI